AQSASVPSAADLAPSISASAAEGGATSHVRYTYQLANGSMSHQAAKLVAIDRGATKVAVVSSPPLWGFTVQIGASHLFGWGARRIGAQVKPGGTLDGFVIDADGLPSIVDAYVVGRVPLSERTVYENYSAPESVPGDSVRENSVHLLTLGPTP